MLRKPEDMKEWQRDTLKSEEPIVGQKAPEGIPTDDLIDVPQVEVIPVPLVQPRKKAPQKKPVVKKTKVEE